MSLRLRLANETIQSNRAPLVLRIPVQKREVNQPSTALSGEFSLTEGEKKEKMKKTRKREKREELSLQLLLFSAQALDLLKSPTLRVAWATWVFCAKAAACLIELRLPEVRDFADQVGLGMKTGLYLGGCCCFCWLGSMYLLLGGCCCCFFRWEACSRFLKFRMVKICVAHRTWPMRVAPPARF